MQEGGLQARARRRYKVTTMSDHDQPVAANLLDRQFAAATPNQRWVSDTTEFVIGSSGRGKLYLAAVLDLFSRFIVGWAVSAVNDRHVTIKALDMALKRRCPDIGLSHHSDQGPRGKGTSAAHSARVASAEVQLGVALLQAGFSGARANLEGKLSSFNDAVFVTSVVDEVGRLSEETATATCAVESSLQVLSA
jgi:transposase InsO family protein